MKLTFLTLGLIAGLSAGFTSCRQTKPTAASAPAAAPQSQAASSSADPATTFDTNLDALPGVAEGHNGEAPKYNCTKDSPPLVMYHPERETLQYCQAGTWVELPKNAALSAAAAKHAQSKKTAGKKKSSSKGKKGGNQAKLAYYHGGHAATPESTKHVAAVQAKPKMTGSFYCRPGSTDEGTYHCMRSVPQKTDKALPKATAHH